jgi:ABC-type proline/glycine betaine transport system permease subunit
VKTKVPFKNNPDERIRMIQASLRCLGFGAASTALMFGVPCAVIVVMNLPSPFRETGLLAVCWLPFVGVTFSVVAWSNLFQAKRAAHGEWNPAASQLLWGRILSALGLLISMVIACFYVGLLLGIFPWQDHRFFNFGE